MDLDHAFSEAHDRARAYATVHNADLPTERCPGCGCEGHCPGVRCPDCGYLHRTSWAILRSTEWGYRVVALNNRRRVFATFNVAL